MAWQVIVIASIVVLAIPYLVLLGFVIDSYIRK